MSAVNAQDVAVVLQMAEDGSSPIINVVRRARILASVAGDEVFTTWLRRELDGYPDGEPPPAWRWVRGAAYAKRLAGWTLLDFAKELELRDGVERRPITNGIAEVAGYAERIGFLTLGVPPGFSALVGSEVVVRVPVEQFTQIIESVRTRILDWVLELQVRHRSAEAAPSATSITTSGPMSGIAPDARKVFIIHGRNAAAASECGRFLRALGLLPVDFDEVRASMGGTPTIADIVTRGMDEAHAVIALFTGDERAELRTDLRSPRDAAADVARWQSRPNVIFEAGMAFGRDRQRVVFVLLGDVDLFTDVAGIAFLRPKNSPDGHRNTLRETLRAMGCPVVGGTAWMREGDFEGCVSVPLLAPTERASTEQVSTEPVSRRDANLFNALKTVLPTSKVEELRDRGWRGPLPLDLIAPITRFAKSWGTVDHEFADPALEALRAELFRAAVLLDNSWQSSMVADDGSPARAAQLPNHWPAERVDATVVRLSDAAQRVIDAHAALVRAIRRRSRM